jgi:hypothetical protein
LRGLIRYNPQSSAGCPHDGSNVINQGSKDLIRGDSVGQCSRNFENAFGVLLGANAQ